MKICTAVCEYNPLHNGHVYHLNYIKENINPDLTVVILSGNFTERGEASVVDKYKKAVWAVKAGADIVLELPTVFAVSNAEIFSKGALKILNSLPGEKVLCFGAETDDKQLLLNTAKTLLNESEEFKTALNKELENGSTLAKSKALALQEITGEKDILTPNNILAIEYIKTILQNGYKFDIQPVKRIGNGFLDESLNENYPSALAIRTALSNGNKNDVENLVPSYVFTDLKNGYYDFNKEILYSLSVKSLSELKNLPDVTEGLENKIQKAVKHSTDLNGFFNEVKSKRYTMSRIKRIAVSSLLNIDKETVLNTLNNDLYLKVLAINKNKDVLSYLSTAKYPVITRKSDLNKLTPYAKKVFEKDVLSNRIYQSSIGIKLNEFDMKKV